MIKTKPVFVKTKNVRNFGVLMDGLELAAGEGRLGLVYGRAGRGKTRTCQWYTAQNDAVYLRMATVWRTSELPFLQALCTECGWQGNPPGRKAVAFTAAVDMLVQRPRPVFLDEIEKLAGWFLDVVRDLSDLSGAPIILVGEEELVSVMRRNRRVWSRTYQQLLFEPIEVRDIIVYAKEFAGLTLSPAVAGIFHKAAGGDFRIVRRDIINLVQILNAKGTAECDQQTAKIAIKTGLGGTA